MLKPQNSQLWWKTVNDWVDEYDRDKGPREQGGLFKVTEVQRERAVWGCFGAESVGLTGVFRALTTLFLLAAY